MTLLGPAEIRDLAAALDLQPTKKLGQNFVVDANTVRRIVRLARVEAVAGDLARVAGRTSVTDGVLLLRHVDTAEDAARLARVAEAAGPKTRRFFDVLGKGRVFRALVRLSDLALTAAALIWATVAQALLALAGWAGGRVFRQAVRAI